MSDAAVERDGVVRWDLGVSFCSYFQWSSVSQLPDHGSVNRGVYVSRSGRHLNSSIASLVLDRRHLSYMKSNKLIGVHRVDLISA